MDVAERHRPSSTVHIRLARRDDVPAIVRLLADDALGSTREKLLDPLPASYYTAYDDIAASPSRTHLVVAVVNDDSGTRVVGTAQLDFLRLMSRCGALFAELHGVRVADSDRGRGFGTAIVCSLVHEARTRGCTMISLESHSSRVDALRFYARLGFEASHVGMKLRL